MWDIRASRVTWLDVDQPAWAESEYPFGRWVMFSDDDGSERCGCVICVDSIHRDDAILSVLSLPPSDFGFRKIEWRKAKWLPQ